MGRVALALAGAALAIVAGALAERAAALRPLRERLRVTAVPAELLDYGTLGDLLRGARLMRAVPNDGTRFPISGPAPADLTQTVFRRKGRVGDTLYEADPDRGEDLAPIVPPAELRASALPLIAITARAEDLHDPGRGIVANWRESWERRAHAAFYQGGTLRTATPAGLRLHGGTSRDPTARVNQARDTRSFRLYFRSRYGLDALEPGVILPVEAGPLRTLVVRKTFTWASALGFDLARRAGARAPAARPAGFVLNGAWQGPVLLAEHLSERQWAARLGHGELVLHRQRATPGARSRRLYGKLEVWAQELQGRATSAEAARYVDLDNLMRTVFTLCFCGNDDWEQGAAVLDLADPQARWSWVCWDMDRGFADETPGWQAREPWQKPGLGLALDDPRERRGSVAALVFGALVAGDPAFRRAFGALACEILNHRLTPAFLEQRVAYYEQLAARLGEPTSAYPRRRRFLAERPAFFLRDLGERLDLGAPLRCEVGAPAGTVLSVDGHEVRAPWSGAYFRGQRIELAATQPGGGRPARWRVGEQEIPGSRLELVVEVPVRVSPVFEP